MTYNDLLTQAGNWISRTDLSPAELALIVQLAEARINRSLRVAALESIYFQPLDADATALVPADYLEFKEVGLYQGIGDASTLLSFSTASRVARLQRTSGEEILDRVTVHRGGTPSHFARVGTRFVLAPVPAGEFSLGGIYYARPAALSELNPTTPLLDANPDLYLWAVVLEAATLTQQPKVPLYEARYEQALGAVQDADERERYSGTQVVTMSGVRE